MQKRRKWLDLKCIQLQIFRKSPPLQQPTPPNLAHFCSYIIKMTSEENALLSSLKINEKLFMKVITTYSSKFVIKAII